MVYILTQTYKKGKSAPTTTLQMAFTEMENAESAIQNLVEGQKEVMGEDNLTIEELTDVLFGIRVSYKEKRSTCVIDRYIVEVPEEDEKTHSNLESLN